MMTGKSLALGFTLILLVCPMVSADSMRGVTWSWHRWTTEHNNGVISNAAPTPAPAPAALPVAAAPSTELLLTVAAPSYAAPAPAPTFTAQTYHYVPPAPTQAPVPVGSADALVNLSDGGFASSDILSGAQPKAWYLSPVVSNLYGGVPNDQQKADFSNAVLQRVNDTFHASGLNPIITNDPTVSASHTLSVASNVSLSDSPGTIGLTDVGHSGFTFIDQLGSAKSLDQLQTVIAKNVSHELMHAFGIGIHPDQTGQFIDSGTVSFDVLSQQAAKFSDQAAADILATQYGSIPFGSTSLGSQVMTPGHGSPCTCASCSGARQMLAAQTVPEPATILVWSIAAMGGLVLSRTRGTMKVA